MPFVKRDAAIPAATDQSSAHSAAAAIANLKDPQAEARWSAARSLGSSPEAVPALAVALSIERASRVREAIMTALIRIGDDASVKALLPYLRSQDAWLRAATIEALQSLPNAISPYIDQLLEDSDPDVRLLATELVRNMPAENATQALCRLLDREQHPNVCAAAIELLAEVGTREAIPALQSCAERFAGVPFLAFAALTAMARISDDEG
jgi:HEAT repeat protein